MGLLLCYICVQLVYNSFLLDGDSDEEKDERDGDDENLINEAGISNSDMLRLVTFNCFSQFLFFV